MPSSAKLAVFISGRGSNFEAVFKACQSGTLNATVELVVSNVPDAAGLLLAKQHNIPTAVIPHTQFDSREAFDQSLLTTLAMYPIDLVILAGFMRILTPAFIQAWSGKLLNIHPSLLPKYPGLNTHERVLAAGDKHSGASIHFVTVQLDGGPVILQAVVDVDPDDTAGTLSARVLEQEHIIYPMAIEWVVTGHALLKNEKCYLDGQTVEKPPQWYNNQLQQPGNT